MAPKGRYGGNTPERVRELLKEAVSKSSQAKVAEHSGLTRQTVQRYIQGIGEPSSKILQKLADYFGVSVWYLLGSSAKQMYEAAGKASEEDPYFKDAWENVTTETVLELESYIKKYPKLWEQFQSIPRENKEEAFKMLKIYMEGLSVASLRLFRERNKLDLALEWHDQEQ